MIIPWWPEWWNEIGGRLKHLDLPFGFVQTAVTA